MATMENPQWPSKYQQSGSGTDNTRDTSNNGDTNNDGAPAEDTAPSPDGLKPDPGDSPTISDKASQLITIILDQMKDLSSTDKYLLYLKLFQVSNVVDPLRQPLNPLGSRSEINRTISWIKTHLEEDPETSLPKQQVYEEYSVYCLQNQIKSLSQADFGKVMKQVYPKVRARRLGMRGQSRYCYSGLRRCLKLKPPRLPDLGDKLQSTEAPPSQSNLQAAAWLILKEWSELHFEASFASLPALARYLVETHSVGEGSAAAAQLLAEAGPAPSKHREMQLQLQKKIHQKERKRKMQSPRPAPKRPRCPRPEASPSGGESSTSTSTSTSPTQGKPICDKSIDFTQLPALPDFKSFQQKPQSGKVAIPRLAATSPKRSPQASPKKQQQIKNAKYKAIQPKPCDNASYNPQAIAADNRSQGVLHNVDRFKERKHEVCDGPSFPLPRERLDSISNVDKDAMDEYLGTNNSQHEEELSKYFGNNHDTTTTSTKLSQLRQLLEQNELTNRLVEPVQAAAAAATPVYAPPPTHSTARRRVSFETPMHDAAAPVPPSPNTRCKNFSFTPISPGPRSPNVSPFVSPASTPLPRAKLPKKKIKREPDAHMSAPVSPMLYNNNKSVLEKLLHSNGKVPYTPDYSVKPALENLEDVLGRSQSVPVQNFLAGDFNEFDPIPEAESATVSRIIETLDEQHAIFEGAPLPDFSLLGNNNLDGFEYGAPRALGRSQSIDCYEVKCSGNPSRSVPSTPLPFDRALKLQPVKSFGAGQSSRSYPSTPIVANEPAFNYALNGDCLLNGQPIRSNGHGDGLAFFMPDLNEPAHDEDFAMSRSFGIVESDNGLMDENNILIGEPNYTNGN